MTPAKGDIVLRRNAPFVEEWSFTDEFLRLIDLTGYTGELEIRLYGRAPGDALVSLQTIATAGQGLRFLADDPFAVRVTIDQPSAAALPVQGGPGSPAVFVYDLALIDPTGFRQIFREGAVITNPGVTL